MLNKALSLHLVEKYGRQKSVSKLRCWMVMTKSIRLSRPLLYQSTKNALLVNRDKTPIVEGWYFVWWLLCQRLD